MRRKFLTLLIGLMMLLSLNSCDVYTYATAQEDIYVETQANVVRSDVDFNIVVRYGTPYYYNGSILYYIYKFCQIDIDCIVGSGCVIIRRTVTMIIG